MRIKRALAGLSLVLGCSAPPPSSVPLGGTEWIAPERHVDRRPRSSAASNTPPVRSAAPSAPAEVAVAAPSQQPEPAPTTVALETRFGLLPLAPGLRILLRTRYTVRATLVTGPDGGDARQSIEADSAERIAVSVVRGGDDGPREVEVEYLESRGTFRMEGSPDEEESNAGKRYTVTFDGAAARVTPRSGSLEPDEDRGVLLDLGTVTGYFAPLKPHLPRSLSPGFRLRPESEDVARVFGAGTDVEFQGTELTLRGRSQGDSNVAIFDCKLPVSFVKDGIELHASLSGTASVRTSRSRPLEVVLRGPISSAAGSLGTGASLNGSVGIELSHEYQDPK